MRTPSVATAILPEDEAPFIKGVVITGRERLDVPFAVAPAFELEASDKAKPLLNCAVSWEPADRVGASPSPREAAVRSFDEPLFSEAVTDKAVG